VRIRSWVSRTVLAANRGDGESHRAKGPSVVSRIRFFALCALVLPYLSTCAFGQNNMSEHAIKSAYLFNFGKFVRIESPEPHPSSSFDICIVGADPLGKTLDDLTANERLQDQPVRVRRVRDAHDARTCSIAYITTNEKNVVEAAFKSLADSDVLTVGDAQDFLKRGGMIQFVNIGNHVRFEVNLDALRKTHLVLSSELLRVAAAVHGDPRPEVH
jgi:hypothetical protein